MIRCAGYGTLTVQHEPMGPQSSALNMPYLYSIFPEQNLIRECFTGRVDLDELKQILLHEWSDPRFRANMDVLSDFRGAQVTLTHDEMLQYANFIAGHESTGKQAIVVSRQLEFGLARMFEMMTSEHDNLWSSLRICYDMSEAQHWIGG